MKSIIKLLFIFLISIPMMVSAKIICNDGSVSPSCDTCHKGCCSRHQGCTENAQDEGDVQYFNQVTEDNVTQDQEEQPIDIVENEETVIITDSDDSLEMQQEQIQDTFVQEEVIESATQINEEIKKETDDDKETDKTTVADTVTSIFTLGTIGYFGHKTAKKSKIFPFTSK